MTLPHPHDPEDDAWLPEGWRLARRGPLRGIWTTYRSSPPYQPPRRPEPADMLPLLDWMPRPITVTDQQQVYAPCGLCEKLRRYDPLHTPPSRYPGIVSIIRCCLQHHVRQWALQNPDPGVRACWSLLQLAETSLPPAAIDDDDDVIYF